MAVDKDKLLEEASFIRFCKIVLGWDYFALLREADVTHLSLFLVDIHVYTIDIKVLIFFLFLSFFLSFFLFKWNQKEKQRERRKDDNEPATSGLREVKKTYKDVDDYLATFEPLLFEEVKALIIQKKDDEEGSSSFYYY